MIATVAALLIMTGLHITVGEQAPKSFAIGSAVRVATICALPLEVFYRVFRPLVRVLNTASNALVRVLGGTPTTGHAGAASLDELRQYITNASTGDEIDDADRQLLQGVFTLDERTASDVMTPRPRVVTLDRAETAAGALALTRGSGHSRFPLLGEEDRLVGLVLGRDLVNALLDGQGDASLESLRREILVAPSAQPLDTLLARLRAEHTSIAAVLDEYGVLDGVVTIEDIVEELVGEIWDEDDRLPGVRRLSDGTLVVAGDTSLADLVAEGVVIGSGSSTSIGGLVQDELARVPRRGDSVRVGDRVLKVLSTDGQRVGRVAIRPLSGPDD